MSDPGPVKLPPAVAAVLGALEASGHQAHLVGAGVLALLEARPVSDFEVTTSAEGRALLEQFAHAVPLDARRSRILLPTSAGPIDLVPGPPDLRSALERRDFTILALAADARGRVLDPTGGAADAAARRLRCVAAADACLEADPLRALRAARLVATRDLEPAPGLVEAMRAAAPRLATVPALRLRGELHPLLRGAAVQRGLELLRASGLETVLAPGVLADAPRVVAALPDDLELRLAAWLRGTRAVRILRNLREPRDRVVAVERLLHLHPIDAVARPEPDPRLRRLARRAAGVLPGLVALRAAEIEARGEGTEARHRFEALRGAFERVLAPEAAATPTPLAIDGATVMEILGCRPGPVVGEALRALAKAIAADPALNTPAALRERLLAWRADRTGG